MRSKCFSSLAAFSAILVSMAGLLSRPLKEISSGVFMEAPLRLVDSAHYAPGNDAPFDQEQSRQRGNQPNTRLPDRCWNFGSATSASALPRLYVRLYSEVIL